MLVFAEVISFVLIWIFPERSGHRSIYHICTSPDGYFSPEIIYGSVANTDGIINKLVTVFALILCTLDNNWRGDKPGFPPLPERNLSNRGQQLARINFVPRHCTSAPRSLCNCGQHMARITSCTATLVILN
jgi:hypothetical protein